MKLWVLLLLATAVVAVVSQNTTSTTKKARTGQTTSNTGKRTTNTGKTTTNTGKTTTKPKAKAKAGAKPPTGWEQNNNTSTTDTPSARKITKPPAKAANNVYSKCMCQDDLGMDQFQLSKYLGTWYMVTMQALMPMNPYTGNCMNATFSATGQSNVIQANTSSKFSISYLKSSDFMTYLGQGVFTWKLSNLTFNTMHVHSNGTKINHVVSAPMNSTLKYVVIDTDYTNYTVAYICGNYSLGTSLKIRANQTTKSSKYASKDFTIPPHLFILMSRAKANATGFDMVAIKNTIRQKYACYHTMNHPSAQDSGTCPA